MDYIKIFFLSYRYKIIKLTKPDYEIRTHLLVMFSNYFKLIETITRKLPVEPFTMGELWHK